MNVQNAIEEVKNKCANQPKDSTDVNVYFYVFYHENGFRKKIFLFTIARQSLVFESATFVV